MADLAISDFIGRRWTKRSDFAIEVCLYMYLLTYFVPGAMAPQHIGMYLGFLIWLFWADKGYMAKVIRHPLFWLWFAFVALMLATTLWSVNPGLTADSWRSRFDDHLLLMPQLIHVARSREGRERLKWILASGGAVVVVMNAIQYVRDFSHFGLSLPINTLFEHRGWAYAMAFFVPFLLQAAASARTRRGAAFWYGLCVVMLLMLFATAARGAWGAVAIELAIWGAYKCTRRQLIQIAAGGAIFVALATLVIPSVMFKERFNAGFNTSYRAEGTWGPAKFMADQRPWTGFGFGDKVFNEEYDRQVDGHPEWFFKKGPTPHSNYFAALFSAGYPGLASLLCLIVGILASAWRLMRAVEGPEEKQFVLALACSFIGFFVIRGVTETVMWEPLFVYVGAIVGMSSVLSGAAKS